MAMQKFLLFLIVLFLALPAQAEEPRPQPHHVMIRLVPERSVIQPGGEIRIAIEQSIDEGWHTYWKNPGDSGTAPRVTWTLPEGFSTGDLQWPVPHKITAANLTNYGYEKSAILLQTLKAPAALPDGPLTLKADIEILVCKEECIPEYGTYELTLNDPAAEPEDNTNYFHNAEGHLPGTSKTEANYSETENGYLLIRWPVQSGGFEKAEFIPEDWGLVQNAAPQDVSIEEGMVLIKQKRGEKPLSSFGTINGLLAVKTDGHYSGVAFTAQKNTVHTDYIISVEFGFLKMLLFALLGGIILNLMPCVFPVLSIKALSLVKSAEKHPEAAKIHGLAYTAGVVLSFIAIAALLIALRATGEQIGWGFQLQNPVVVTLLAYLLFIIGLNLSGVFEVPALLGNLGGNLAKGEGFRASFFTGVLATLVATPCTAPFMAAAIGAALLLPAAASLLIFAALGFGLALPYLLLCFVPALRKILPRPGKWMETFKQFLAFPMYASAAWLVWVLSQQAGPMGVFGALMGLVLIAFGIWLLGFAPKKKLWNWKLKLLALLSILAALALLPAAHMEEVKQQEAPVFGEAWTPEKLQELLEGDDPVFVEMTAAWCITCKINHAAAIDIAATRELFSRNKVHYLIGDWTSQDAGITKYLNSFGRNGVPLYIYYAPGKGGGRPEPVILPQILTPGIVKETVEQ
ncbi:MAG: thioredoxin family protein [Alphaproteobacteria bacterium]|nr:thioredoxin family protein [Alphaproteobacteria bacterium]